jgi:hypothetical protein
MVIEALEVVCGVIPRLELPRLRVMARRHGPVHRTGVKFWSFALASRRPFFWSFPLGMTSCHMDLRAKKVNSRDQMSPVRWPESTGTAGQSRVFASKAAFLPSSNSHPDLLAFG